MIPAQTKAVKAAYLALMDEYTGGLPKSYLGFSSEMAMLAYHYINAGSAINARHYMARAGVPTDVLLGVDALIRG